MLEDRLREELESEFCGRQMEENANLEEETLLEGNGTLEDDDGNETEITETMSIQIELDEDNCIESIYVSFHTSCWGDSGLGEEDPEDYFDFDTCYDEACEFIQNQLVDEDEEDEDDGTIDWDDYVDFPFAMETVNGSIINLSAELQNIMAEKLAEQCGITKEQLAHWLDIDTEWPDEADEDSDFPNELEEYNIDFLQDIFPVSEGEFEFRGIGFLDSKYGDDVCGMLDSFGFELGKDVSDGAHGHDSSAVYYLTDSDLENC